jgi:hypothetical protein
MTSRRSDQSPLTSQPNIPPIPTADNLENQTVNKLLMRSAELENRLLDFFHVTPRQESDRRASSRILLSVAMEHAESLKMLIAGGNCTSAIGLLRLQYEALVRAIWLSYAASPNVVSELCSELTSKSARRASNKLPMLSEMLTKLDGKAPKEAMDLLLEFKEYHWKPLSSFVHGGIHAMSRHSTGYPPPLLEGLIKASNGVSMMIGMMLVILCDDPSLEGNMPAIQLEFRDCLPQIREP